MSITQSKTHSFVVSAPDHTDADSPKRRKDAAEQHIKNMTQFGKDGIFRTGGVTLAHDGINIADGKVTGSMMIFECESITDVKKIIEGDVSWTDRVIRWDHEKLQIIPFFSPVPVPALLT
ncbi:hypothetical protein BC835DRAFT_1472926 [Cytidiella melzeri]|nr:hypothetical protein BC835DRAFT_1472926 [Cytidiella melzeri]